MRPRDYGLFHSHWFARAPRANTPAAKVSGPVAYGLGMFQRPWKDGANYWHFGALCFPGRLETGSFAATWANGWSVVATYDTCINGKEMGALDRVVVQAVFGALK